MKIFLETFGCQMNELDSEVIRSILRQADYDFVEGPEQADIVLMNTCAVRENAHNKVYQRVNEFKKARRDGRLRAIGVLGCMAQSLRRELCEKAPLVDIVAGPDSYKKLPELLGAVLEREEKCLEFSLSEHETYGDIVPQRMPGINAWVAVMRGCDNFCTFCVVPYTRGRERSIAPEVILDEIRDIVRQGYRQVTLLGQNVNSYRHENTDFAGLMEKIAALDIKRVRFTSPHPKDFSRSLLDVIARHSNLCKHIHLPLQSGSDAVLERMGRNYTRRSYLDLAAEIRAALPGVSLTTDVICGFCGETEEDFAHTAAVMEEVGFDSAFIFKYSERKDTIAARKYKDDVPDSVKSERVTALNAIQRRISKKRNQAELGKTFEVLVEQESKKNPGEWFGRTDHNKGVVFSAPDKAPGDSVHVFITEASTNTLRGRPAGR